MLRKNVRAVRTLRLINDPGKAPGRVIKLHNGNWFGLCYLCGTHHHSLTWVTAFSRMSSHIKIAHTYTMES